LIDSRCPKWPGPHFAARNKQGNEFGNQALHPFLFSPSSLLGPVSVPGATPLTRQSGQNRFLIVTVCLILAQNCVSSFDRKEILVVSDNIAVYRIPSVIFPAPEIQMQMSRQIAYPDLDLDTLTKLLAFLSYSRKGIPPRHGYVFYQEQLEELTRRLKHSMSAPNNNYRIIIATRHGGDGMLFNSPDRTSMIIWVDEQGINIVFGAIREWISERNYAIDRDDWAQIAPVDLTKAQDDLSLDESTHYEFKRVNGQIHKTWVIIPQANLSKLPTTAMRTSDREAPAADKQKVEPRENLEERLTNLKRAFEKGLITKSEYDEKRKEILSHY